MKTIYKYDLDIHREVNELKLPLDAYILDVQWQYGKPVLWAQVETTAPVVPRYILTGTTGNPLPTGFIGLLHIGTVQINNGSLVLHFFEGFKESA